ncbi:MAG: DUF2239 family protein [Polymorphobacter sp.]
MDTQTHSLFEGNQRIATGSLASVAAGLHAVQGSAAGPLLVFRHADGAVVDIDIRGSISDVLARLGVAAPGRGRPRLGVVAREVTLLPRHWEWLAAQPGGASVALRRLVDAARRAGDGESRAARDAAYRFMAAIAGDLPGFEAAARALFAGDADAFAGQIAAWPADIAATITEISAARP